MLEDSHFDFTFAESAFVDVDAGDSLTYGAALSDGSPLPSWLNFTANQRMFSGTPANDDVGSFFVRVTATDEAGAAVSTEFAIAVVNVHCRFRIKPRHRMRPLTSRFPLTPLATWMRVTAFATGQRSRTVHPSRHG